MEIETGTKHLGFSRACLPSCCFVALPPSLPIPFFFSCPHPHRSLPPPHISSLLSPSSLFYLNLPQICPSTKQLPSLFGAIMCGSAAVGLPGRQSPANRVSVSYCGVCPGRSITSCLTPYTGSCGKPAGHSWNLHPLPLYIQGFGIGDPDGPQEHSGSFQVTEDLTDCPPSCKSKVGLFYSALKAGN